MLFQRPQFIKFSGGGNSLFVLCKCSIGASHAWAKRNLGIYSYVKSPQYQHDILITVLKLCMFLIIFENNQFTIISVLLTTTHNKHKHAVLKCQLLQFLFAHKSHIHCN